MEPSSVNAKRGETFEVLLKLNTQGESVYTTDTHIEFDPSVLSKPKMTQVNDKEAFFPTLLQKIYSSYVYVGSYTLPPPQGKPKVGDGTIAKMQFTVVKETPTQLKIRCTPGKANDSNVSTKKNGKIIDVLDCSKLQPLLVNSVSSTTPTPTTGPTVTPMQAPTNTPTVTPTSTQAPTVAPTRTPTTSTPTPSPSVLPETGIMQTTGIIIAVGVSLTVVSFLIKLYVS